MKLDGFDNRIGKTSDGDDYIDYYPEGEKTTKVLRCRASEFGSIIEVVEYGGVAEVEQGERVSSPDTNPLVQRRLLIAMACLHFSANWLEDEFAHVDLEMVRRGFTVGVMGEDYIWFRKELGATFIVKRDDSGDLPSSFRDPATLTVIGVTGKQMDVSTLDFRALVTLMERDMHYHLYNPEHDMHLKGVRTIVKSEKPRLQSSSMH